MPAHTRLLSPAQAIALLVGLSGGALVSMMPTQAGSISPQVLQELQSALQNGTLKLAGPESASGETNDILQQMQVGFPNTKVDPIQSTHEAAISDVQQGKADVAALGRNLSEPEKQQGLRAFVLPRRKVAIIVGRDNPFTGSLTKDQFAQIFRGETTDWSGVGGAAGTIRFIDRPDNSDTRLALSQYPVFQEKPFEHGANAEQISSTDKTEDIVNKLGRDGISYAPVDHVKDNPNVRILPLHQVMPSDPRYAFSQPTYYAFKTPCPTAGAQAFLNYAAQTPDSSKLSELYSVETCAAEAAKPAGNGNWWWLLLPLLAGAGLLAWFFRGRGGAAPAVVPPLVPPVSRELPSRLILTPQDCRNAYAYWEVPDSRRAELRQQGGEQLKLRLYDVTDGIRASETPVAEHLCSGTEPDLQLAIPRDDRDYVAELGYLTGIGRWLPLTRSAKVRVPACVPAPTATGIGTVGIAAAGVAAAGAVTAAVGAARQPVTPVAPRLVLVPRNANDLYAYWEVPETALAATRQKGGRDLRVRLYDVTDGVIHPSLTQEFDCSEIDHDLHMTVPAGNRSYRAELGYFTADHNWLPLANSTSVTMPTAVAQPQSSPAAAGGVATAPAPSPAASGSGALMARPAEMGYVRAPLPRPGGSELHIEAKAPKLAYVHWHLTEDDKLEARQRGGEQLALRIYDVTGIDLDQQLPHRMLQYNCSETEENRTLVVPSGDRDYLAEIGYLTENASWFGLVRSVHAHIPSGQG